MSSVFDPHTLPSSPTCENCELFGKIPGQEELASKALTIIVVGASGDLARKKTYPALFELYKKKLIPRHATVVGYARSEMTDEKYKAQISAHFKGSADVQQRFLSRCFYVSGAYDKVESFSKLRAFLEALEAKENGPSANRVFYFAIPPSVFVPVARSVHEACSSTTGWTRVVIEKPFGRDLESSRELAMSLSSVFREEQMYRIDHYLGKEMVQNLMVLRFANSIFEPLWNHHHVASVLITFKEDIGTEGRGGYFDNYGIIRDVMQNHLIQILALVAMEPPVAISSKYVRDEKVKVLESIEPLRLEDIVIGQYTSSVDGTKPGYLDDEGVPKDSVTPTFAQAVLRVNNQRWGDVPFILKCGKALESRKAEIRIKFRKPPGRLFPNAPQQELVLRVQPNEAIYIKMLTKEPGLSDDVTMSELDLTYKSRFEDTALPDAYERLILDVVRGDHNLFVRDDELDAAWRIFTPLLKELESSRVKPEPYVFGTRGPESADRRLQEVGFRPTQGYQWKKQV